jgi:predicted O-methyltransferase YrrM
VQLQQGSPRLGFVPTMAWTTSMKQALNSVLEPFNMRLDTLTAQRREAERLKRLSDANHFEARIFPVPASVSACDPLPVVAAVRQHRQRFDTFLDAQANDVGYEFSNHYFSSPDAEVLYAMVRACQPRTIIEVGSGHSTKISRQAILDGGLSTQLIAIDPDPRVDIDALADELHKQAVETLETNAFDRLQRGDILFIDSSHEIKPGNDCAFLYLRLMPLLPVGVVIHVHDIFLPFEYPESWIRDQHWPWTEQYLVQAMLMSGDAFEVLWPGYHLQQTCPEFAEWFPHAGNRRAQSFWLRKRI